MLAKVNFRNGGSYFTAIDDCHAPETLAQRMVGGGFVICEDSRWGKHRVIVVNLSDVQSIVLEPSNKASTPTAGTHSDKSELSDLPGDTVKLGGRSTSGG